METVAITHNCKIKIICRLKDQQYQESVYLDQVLQEQDTVSPVSYRILQSAKRFLHAFSPEVMLRDLCGQYGEDSVLVFRTTEQEMKQFCEMNFQEIFTQNA